KCRECREYVYIEFLNEHRSNYPCPNCNIYNEMTAKQAEKHFNIEEIPWDEYSLGRKNITKKPEKEKLEKLNINNDDLSIKYEVLDSYKGLAYLLMFVSTGFFIYSLVQISDTMGKYAGSVMLPTIITYVITMFSLFCLTKMIDFLFDLDKQDKILVPDKISNAEE
ncbi:MAG: hypothetical protein ACKVLE_09075, partial [Fidelibacterota bacterium]